MSAAGLAAGRSSLIEMNASESVTLLSHSGDEREYRFQLAEPPSPRWGQLFDERLAQRMTEVGRLDPSTDITRVGSDVVARSVPADWLEGTRAFVDLVVSQTNREIERPDLAYADGRASVPVTA
jgi:hypothetical protein